MVQPITNIDDPRYVKALAHPVRIRILAMLEEEASSPVQLAKRLDATLGAVAYHVRTLHNLGLIELVETRQRRGATEHVYRALDPPRFSDEAWGALSPIAKQQMLSAMLRQIGEYANASAAAGGFDRAESALTRTALKLDERGWRQLARATKTWMRQVERIEESAAKRLEKADKAGELDAGLVIMLFEAMPFSRRQPDADSGGPAGRGSGRGRSSSKD